MEDKLLDDIKKKFDVNISVTPGKTEFATKLVHIVDPRGIGVPLELSINSEGTFSGVSIVGYNQGWLNIAEGHTSQDFER